ncbi:hypothetical protein EVAR_41110_1 [Eumeta japonica]|uniref:Uncharacterized protein n=1 Tax=Eumeta variegata TaxID=151549 RepID=A0A4C1XAC0_EUMVA|nr:hypothetical protein EVAR_41110_1 [Eumeta japonica]
MDKRMSLKLKGPTTRPSPAPLEGESLAMTESRAGCFNIYNTASFIKAEIFRGYLAGVGGAAGRAGQGGANTL